MPPASAAFGGQQVVVAISLVEMRSFGEPKRSALEYQVNRPNQSALGSRVLLQNDPGKPVLSGAMIPAHIDHIFPAIVVMEQRRIKAAAVEVNGIRPLAVDARSCDEIVVGVAQGSARWTSLSRAAISLHIRVEQPEEAVGMAEARGPNAARIRIAKHVQLAGAIQRPRQQTPMRQIARVVYLDARIPLECGRRDVIVVPNANNRGVRIKPAQDRV